MDFPAFRHCYQRILLGNSTATLPDQAESGTSGLALGTLYLLAPRKVANLWLALMVAATVFSIILLAGAEVDPIKLKSDTEPGWQAINRSALIKIMMIAMNSIGTLIIAGGAIYSALRGRYRRANILIVIGTLIVAMAGSLATFGRSGFHSIGQAIGITVMFIGFLMTMTGIRPASNTYHADNPGATGTS